MPFRTPKQNKNETNKDKVLVLCIKNLYFF